MRSLFEFCWMWIFPQVKLSWHSCSMWDKLGWFNWFWQFLCEGLFSFNPKGFCCSYAWSCSLCERRTSFFMGLVLRKFCGFSLMFSTGFTSFIVFFLFSVLITFIFMHSSFNPKGFCYSYAWSCSLCERRTSFFMGLILRKLCGFLLMFSTGFTSFSVLLLFSVLITFTFIHNFWCYFIKHGLGFLNQSPC